MQGARETCAQQQGEGGGLAGERYRHQPPTRSGHQQDQHHQPGHHHAAAKRDCLDPFRRPPRYIVDDTEEADMNDERQRRRVGLAEPAEHERGVRHQDGPAGGMSAIGSSERFRPIPVAEKGELGEIDPAAVFVALQRNVFDPVAAGDHDPDHQKKNQHRVQHACTRESPAVNFRHQPDQPTPGHRGHHVRVMVRGMPASALPR